MKPLHSDLELLAGQAGVLTSYRGIYDRDCTAAPEPLMAVLRALDVPVHSVKDAARVARSLRRKNWQSPTEPVVVAWEGAPVRFTLRIPAAFVSRRLKVSLQPESGGRSRTLERQIRALPEVGRTQVDGTTYYVKEVSIPGQLRLGYYRLTVEIGRLSAEALLIAAPAKIPSVAPNRRSWGLFAPLHAIWSRRSWGIGDFTDLESLADFTRAHGGRLLGTLPFYAAFLDFPHDPSPYSPCSRLFLNEVFLDCERIPEWDTCDDARALANSRGFRAVQKQLLREPYVDYRGVLGLKRQVLTAMCSSLVEGRSARARKFRRDVTADEPLADYARFRATIEKTHAVWQQWPGRLKNGIIKPSDYDHDAAAYHAYVQWAAREQLAEISDGLAKRRVWLYLDLPLGVNPAGYDVYRHRDLFALSTSVGAPPDPFFTAGQDWGFPALRPQVLRRRGYDYFRAVIRVALRHAGMLRIDHIMAFHRLFVIPHGFGSGDGVYIRYAPEEMYAIVCLEAHRAGAAIVGEDLGTVPPEVRREMQKRGLNRMYVTQFSLPTKPGGTPAPMPRNVMAALNTHDMPTFAGFYKGTDIDLRVELGLLKKREARSEHALRKRQTGGLARALRRGRILTQRATPRSVMQAMLAYLARSRARHLLVSLEDLWLEKQSQNVPGTYHEKPNWRRRARLSLERLPGQRTVVDTLRRIQLLRSGKRKKHGR